MEGAILEPLLLLGLETDLEVREGRLLRDRREQGAARRVAEALRRLQVEREAREVVPQEPQDEVHAPRRQLVEPLREDADGDLAGNRLQVFALRQADLDVPDVPVPRKEIGPDAEAVLSRGRRDAQGPALPRRRARELQRVLLVRMLLLDQQARQRNPVRGRKFEVTAQAVFDDLERGLAQVEGELVESALAQQLEDRALRACVLHLDQQAKLPGRQGRLLVELQAVSEQRCLEYAPSAKDCVRDRDPAKSIPLEPLTGNRVARLAPVGRVLVPVRAGDTPILVAVAGAAGTELVDSELGAVLEREGNLNGPQLVLDELKYFLQDVHELLQRRFRELNFRELSLQVQLRLLIPLRRGLRT